MENRILSPEECEILSPDAVKLIYRYIHRQSVPSDIIEKTLLNALVVSRMNQCIVNAEMLSLLMERISEFEGMPILDMDIDSADMTYRYC